MRTIDAEAVSAADRATVWRHLLRADVWRSWGRFTSSTRERPGDGDPDGPGSIRRLRIGPGGSREQNVEVEPERRLVYTMLAGLPIDAYRAEVTLTDLPDGGTRIHWHSTFTPRLPGTGLLFRLMLSGILRGLAKGLARHSADCRPPCPLA